MNFVDFQDQVLKEADIYPQTSVSVCTGSAQRKKKKKTQTFTALMPHKGIRIKH